MTRIGAPVNVAGIEAAPGPSADRPFLRWALPLAILIGHLAIYLLLVGRRSIPPLELFNVLLVVGNVIAFFTLRRRGNLLIGTAIMILLATHTAIGQFVAPDTLTSGAILLVNILVVYSGLNIYLHQPRIYAFVYLASFLSLFLLFVVALSNAEALFLLFLMGLAATGRSFKLLAYFWCLTLSFTFFQPYAWQALFGSFLVLYAVFGVRGSVDSALARVFLACGLILVLFVLLPVFVVVMNEDFRSMLALLQDARVIAAFRITLLTSVLSTLVLMFFGIPLAYAVARLEFPGKTFLEALIQVPIVIPQSVAGIALLAVFGRRQFVGEAFAHYLGVSFDGTIFGICLAQVFVAMPFLVKSAVGAFEGVPVRLELAARTLGASPARAFARVCLPLASRGLLLGAILAWARAAGEFGALLFIAPNPETVPVLAFNRFGSLGSAETTPLVAMALLFSLAMFFLLQLVVRAAPAAAGREAT